MAGGDDWLIARFAAMDPVMLSAGLQQAADRLRKEDGGWIEVVPGLSDLSVRFDAMVETPGHARDRLARALADAPEIATGELALIDIPVCYGGAYGPDLARCAQILSLSEQEIISLHTAAPVLVQMMGFAPGFAYCGQTPEALSVDRLDEPRQRVEAGAIGIAGRQTCLYSIAGPGGWPLIGRTPTRLFDVTRDDPFTLKAGMQVRFRAINEDAFERLLAEAG